MANIWYIQVNRHCNNKCHFCSNPSIWVDMDYERGIELINDFIKRWYSWIIFTWGEPTLSPNIHDWIKYSVSKNMECRVISNWSICSHFEYMEKFKQDWLSLIHFSLYSHIPKVHDFLTNTPWSYKKVLKSIQNALKLGITVQLNCVINKYNENHLDKTVKFVVKNFPSINHFVWNNLDPEMMRKTKIALSTLPDYDKASESLLKALKFLEKNKKTFRVERFPLCYMRWFEFASTETRKIVKEEERIIHFLDFRETVSQTKWSFYHDKLQECSKCDLNLICAWIYEREKYYNYVKVYPQKLKDSEIKNIIKKINEN